MSTPPTLPPPVATPGAPAPAAPAAPAIDLHDVQGNVLRGYRAGRARHFALAITDPHGASAFLAGLVSGDEAASPQLTTAAEWHARPTYFLNVGLTHDGLAALGLPAALLGAFPEAFRRGPTFQRPPQGPLDRGVDVPASLGDVGESAPARWILGRPGGDPVHLMVSLHTGRADDHASEHLEAVTARLRAAFAAHGLAETSCHDAQWLPGATVHFGFRDGIGQPRVTGAPGRQDANMQPPASPGEFLLGRGHVNQYGGNFLGDLPEALGDNATYVAVRIIEQDVAAFEEFIARSARQWNLDPELVAAKMMGRWRNGKPLTLAPDDPDTPVGEHRLDAYDYAPGDDHATYYDDARGLRCPIGAHARRLNPRGALVMGKPHSRRVIRRGMPYGPPFDPAHPDDGASRGLIGLFVCGDLEMQFEFLVGTWANGDFSTSGLRGTVDPIIGTQREGGGTFLIRTEDGRDPITLTGVPQLVTTRGTVYTFAPGVGGVRYLAERRWETPAQPLGYPSVEDRLEDAPRPDA